MKFKKTSLIITFLLISMTFSMIVSVKADYIYSYDYQNTYFDYDVKEGDVFEYNMNFAFNFSGSSTFYNEMDTWLIAEDFTKDDFSLETFVDDLKTFLDVDYKLKMDITDLYSQKLTITHTTGDYHEQYLDIINGSLRADLNEGNRWENYDVVVVDKLKDSLTFMEKYLDDTEYAKFEANVTDLIDQAENPLYQPDWDNSQISGFYSAYKEYNSDGTLKEYPPFELENGTTEPVNPFPEFGGPANVPIFLPSEMNFEEYYDYFTKMVNFNIIYTIENYDPYMPVSYFSIFDSTDTFQSLLDEGGVSDIHVNEKSVGIIWNMDFVNTDFLEEQSNVNFTDYLPMFGIDDYTGKASFAVEYDNDWALVSMTIYAHIGVTLDTNEIPEYPPYFQFGM